MPDLIEIMESFNRKERFFLISQALGKPKFTLSRDFRLELAEAVGLEQGIEIPADAFAAMDYHLDSVAASLACMDEGKGLDGVFPNPGQKVVEGNQEDIDLLVAFAHSGKYHLIFVEAKAYSYWGSDQLRKKVSRLERDFGSSGGKCNGVGPHFSLMSPNPPQNSSVQWLEWMLGENGKPHHLKMSLPPKNKRRRAERCDENGSKTSNGEYFHCPFD